jgi:hypothetical protein
MTAAEALQRTIELCDARFEAELEKSELLLIDHGATAEEVEAAIGSHGFVRKMLERARSAQIAEVTAWLAGGGPTWH